MYTHIFFKKKICPVVIHFIIKTKHSKSHVASCASAKC